MRPVAVLAMLLALAAKAAAQDFELEVTENGLNRLIEPLGDPSGSGVQQPDALGGLGYSGCVSVGSLECPGSMPGPATPAAPTVAALDVKAPVGVPANGAATPPATPVPLVSCRDPEGRTVIVPALDAIPWQWWITQARFKIEPQQLSFSATVLSRVARRWESEERTVPATVSLDAANQRLRVQVSAFKVPLRYRVAGVDVLLSEVDVGRYLSFAIPISAQPIRVPGLDGSVRTVTARVQGANVQYQAGRMLVSVDAAID